jgi:hypothetical protein
MITVSKNAETNVVVVTATCAMVDVTVKNTKESRSDYFRGYSRKTAAVWILFA